MASPNWARVSVVPSSSHLLHDMSAICMGCILQDCNSILTV